MQVQRHRHVSLHVTKRALGASTFTSSGAHPVLGVEEDQSGTSFWKRGRARRPSGTHQEGLLDGSAYRKDVGPLA